MAWWELRGLGHAGERFHPVGDASTQTAGSRSELKVHAAPAVAGLLEVRGKTRGGHAAHGGLAEFPPSEGGGEGEGTGAGLGGQGRRMALGGEVWNLREGHFREKEMSDPRESCQGVHARPGLMLNALEGKLEEWPLDCPRGRRLGTNTGHFNEVSGSAARFQGAEEWMGHFGKEVKCYRTGQP